MSILLLIGAFAAVSAFPEHLACSRIIKIGQPIMGGLFQGGSTAASIRLDKVPCGGILSIDTDYVPVITGIPSNSFLSGEHRDPCILDRNESVPNNVKVSFDSHRAYKVSSNLNPDIKTAEVSRRVWCDV